MTGRPCILVSNDDGWHSPGLNQLADALEAIADVIVVAPERERSAVGHSITLHKPLRLRSYGERRWWCSGTPTDAVYMGLHHVAARPVSLVVSGVNRGPNLADDVHYSGTVAAAMEGVLLGVPAIAVSLASSDPRPDFVPATELATRLARDVLHNGLPERILLNVNVPAPWRSGDPVVTATLGRRRYGIAVEECKDPRGRSYYWIGGSTVSHDDLPGSDCNHVDRGHATVTPIHLDMTAHGLLDRIRSWQTLRG